MDEKNPSCFPQQLKALECRGGDEKNPGCFPQQQKRQNMGYVWGEWGPVFPSSRSGRTGGMCGESAGGARLLHSSPPLPLAPLAEAAAAAVTERCFCGMDEKNPGCFPQQQKRQNMRYVWGK